MSTPTLTTYKVKPRACRKFISDILYARQVPVVRTSPGVGKSALMREVCIEHNLKMIDHRLSTSEPTDMTGLPNFTEDGKAYFAPFSEIFPVVGDPLPTEDIWDEKGESIIRVHQYAGWNLFMDELPSAARNVQAAAYKVFLDHMVGQRKLHPRVVLSAAGNLDTDRAVVNPIPTAMQTRLVHLELQADQEEWLADVAFKKKFDSRIIGFISQFGDKLMDFRPDHKDKTFACPRTWDFLNDQIQSYNRRGIQLTDEHALLFAGYIGFAVTLEFLQYIKVWSKLVSVKQVVADPLTLPIPVEAEIKWATVSMLMQNVRDDNFEAISMYINRFTDTSFKLLFYRMCLVKDSNIRSHKAFGPAAQLISQHLNPDWNVTKNLVRP